VDASGTARPEVGATVGGIEHDDVEPGRLRGWGSLRGACARDGSLRGSRLR
jgi:hypothetical protein